MWFLLTPYLQHISRDVLCQEQALMKSHINMKVQKSITQVIKHLVELKLYSRIIQHFFSQACVTLQS